MVAGLEGAEVDASAQDAGASFEHEIGGAIALPFTDDGVGGGVVDLLEMLDELAQLSVAERAQCGNLAQCLAAGTTCRRAGRLG